MNETLNASTLRLLWKQRLIFLSSILAVIGLTTAVYLPSLGGPYVLDDVGNLTPLKRWLEGALSWQAVLLDNRSGPTGRPLSMATFLFDAWRTRNMDSFTFKSTNLAIHLICGFTVYSLVRQLLELASKRNSLHIKWISLFAAALWLWLPIQVSTVAYVIQRMAQLSAFWVLATITTYIFFRTRLMAARSSLINAGLWVCVPLCATAALLSKESGAVAFPLIGVVEWIAFRGALRPNTLKAFLTLFIALPALIVAAYLLSNPDYFASGYLGRDFTMEQRLLTEPRILWRYIETSFFPTASSLGIYHDNYPISTSMWRPAATTFAIFLWLVVSVWAVMWRRKAPLFAIGVVGYLVAHVVESGPIALELYFEHRNYLPSVFCIIGITGLMLYCWETYPLTKLFRRYAIACSTILLALYAFGAWNQAYAWSDADKFYSLQYSYNQTSPRLISALAARSILAKDLPGALAYIDASEKVENESERGTSALWRILAYCKTDTHPIPSDLYAGLESRAHGRITNFGMTAWDLLGDSVQEGCPGLDSRRIAHAGVEWILGSGQPPNQQPVWRTKYNIGRILVADGELEDAESLLLEAWTSSNKNNGVGAMLFQVAASLGQASLCRDVLSSLERSYGRGDQTLDKAVESFRVILRDIEAHPIHAQQEVHDRANGR